jgi:hypothetical protein
MNKIEKKIISYKVLTKDKEEVIKESSEVLPTDKITAILPKEPVVKYMGEHVERLEVLDGKTYKIKPSTSEHAYYITINNIEVEGKLHPYELFINSKGIEHYKLLGFARLVSAIFRKGGDISFLHEELKQIYDPVGAYTSKRTYGSGKRKRFNSIEAEIGDIIEEHLLNLSKENELDELIALAVSDVTHDSLYEEPAPTGFPPNATHCNKCNYKAVVLLDGCNTCLNCGDSKCG